ncbi:hypothetical protein LCGC14_2114450 [marine sediment metagenome]|uniref:Uncharacterized protein n=1 Tax=marine sediment metagenome TaxID=412755 RepID=A0A0F9E684_9ZZZZ
MKEYHIVGSGLSNVISKINEMAKQGWVPTHFAMVTDNDVDTFGVLLERESLTTSLPIKEDRKA